MGLVTNFRFELLAPSPYSEPLFNAIADRGQLSTIAVRKISPTSQNKMESPQRALSSFVNADDPARNDVVTERVLCSLCHHILTDSAILNPSKRKDEKKVEKPPRVGSTTGLARELDTKAHAFMAYHRATKQEQVMQDHDKACLVERYRHHQTLQDMKASSDSGCHLCSIIWHNWEVRIEISLIHEPALAERQQQFYMYIACRQQKDGRDSVELYVNPFADEDGKDGLCGSITALQRDKHTAKLAQMRNYPTAVGLSPPASALDDSVRQDSQLARLARTTASDYTIALARFWLQSCISTHNSLCDPPPPFSEPGFLPTRLLDLGHVVGTARVVTTAELDPRPTAYLTLSHCWGGASPLSLTAATSNTLREGVTLSTLPKTFGDAARVTLGLGYRYLWIDSLCIQQDSAADWALESRSMDLVYRRSVLTLAALAASTSHDGLYVRRNPLCYRACDLMGVTEYPLKIDGQHFRRHTAPRGEWFGGQGGDSGEVSYLVNRHGDDGRAGSNLRLRQRGWVFQEDLLARRTLYFGVDGIYWECLESKLDEAHNAGDGWGTCAWCPRDASLTLKYHFHRLETLFRGRTSTGTKESGYNFEEFHLRWWGVLEEYTKLDLTQAEDKLVAVHGLIKALETSSGTKLTSVAGHWRQHLPFDLLWATGGGSSMSRPNTCMRSAEYRAPSWSWAAVEGPVRFVWVFMRLNAGMDAERGFDFTIQPDAEVLDITLTPKYEGSRFNGQLCGGHMTLSARTRTLTWGEMGDAHFKLNGGPRLRGQGYCHWIQDDHRESHTEVRCVLLARMRQDHERSETIYLDAGLALIPHPTSPGSWMRVGIFSQDYYESGKKAKYVFFRDRDKAVEREVIRIE